MVHVREHGQLQRLDLKLRAICIGGFKPGSLAREWDRARRIRCDLTSPRSEVVTEASGNPLVVRGVADLAALRVAWRARGSGSRL